MNESGSFLKRLGRLIVRGRNDLGIVLCIILLTVSVVSARCAYEFAVYGVYGNTAVFFWGWWLLNSIVLFVCGIVLGWGRRSLPWILIISAVCLTGAGLHYLVFSAGENAESLQGYVGSWVMGGDPYPARYGDANGLVWWAPLIIFPLSFLAGWLPVAAVCGIAAYSRYKKSAGGKGVTRVRVLATIAAILLVLAMIRNIADVNGYTFIGEAFLEIIINVLFWLLIYAVFFFVFSYGLIFGERTLTRRVIPYLIAGLPLSLASGLFALHLSNGRYEYAFLFAVSLFLYATCLFTYKVVVKRDDVEDQSARFGIPGLFVLCVMGVAIAIIAIPLRYDVTTLLFERFDFKKARLVKRLQNNPQIELDIVTRFSELECNFDKTTSPDVLAGFPGLGVYPQVVIMRGLSPSIDLKPMVEQTARLPVILNNGLPNGTVSSGDSWFFENGQMSPEQFVDVCNARDSLTLVNVDMAESPAGSNLPECIPAAIVTISGGEPTPFLEMFNKNCTGRYFSIGLEETPDAKFWESVLQLAGNNSVSIIFPDVDPGKAWEPYSDDPNFSGLEIGPGKSFFEEDVDGKSEAVRNMEQLLYTTNAVVSPHIAATFRRDDRRGRRFWESAYLSPGELDGIQFADGGYSTSVDECFGVFGTNAAGEPTHVFCPAFRDREVERSAIEILSVDAAWLFAAELRAPHFNDGRPLGLDGFSALRELYFPRAESGTQRAECAEPIATLEHLQISVYEIVGNLNWARDFPNLTSITLFGKYTDGGIGPDLDRMESLKKFQYFYDADYELFVWEAGESSGAVLNDAVQSRIEALLPGIEVIVAPDSSYDPQIPIEFQQHADEVRAQLRQQMGLPDTVDEEPAPANGNGSADNS
ncbi:MAG: hypothetical protein AAF456_05860 [Planctomycetota bacterium]